MDIAAAKLEAARHELLDLGLRNPLLNYRPLAARGVEIINERPSPIYHHLVTNGRTLSFLPATSDNGDELGQPAATADPHEDDYLQTPYSDADLQKRLLNTAYIAADYIQEQGVNVLYLALGMLHWRDRDTPDAIRRAPLLLIPVALERLNVASRFTLRCTGADIGDNLPLRTRLARDFGLTLPPLPAEDGLDAHLYLTQIAHAIHIMPAWTVDTTAVALSFFSFSKFLMYHDLDAANWPAAHSPAAHPVLQALLTPQGFPQPGAQLPDDALLDAHIRLESSHQVVDADSSQTLAILDVNAGHNLVIQGPPGTGKSQTITNLIAEALGNGKTVLFVAEKQAALDVVKRRLDEAGLEDACLELHSYKGAKSAFLAELARSLRHGQPKTDGRFPHLPTLKTLRDRLNAYSQAINDPIGSSSVALYDAYGRHLQLQARLSPFELPRLTIPQLSAWSAAEFQARLALAYNLQQQLIQTGIPNQHPLWGSQRTDAPDALPDQLRGLAKMALDALQPLQSAAATLAETLDTAVPTHLTALAQLQFAAQRLQSAPRMPGVNATHPAWATLAEALLAALEAGERIHQAHDAYDDWLIPEAWSQDVLPIRQGLMAGRSSLRRFFSGSYRRAQTQLAGLCRTTPPPDWETQLAAVDAILDAQRAHPVLAAVEPQLKEIFGLRWRGLESNWGDLRHIAGWLASIHDSVRQGMYPPRLLQLVAQPFDKTNLETAVAAIETTQINYETAVNALHEQVQFDPATLPGAQPFLSQPLADQFAWLQRAHAAATAILPLAAYNRLATQLAAHGLAPLTAVADAWPHATDHLADLLQLARYAALIHKAHAERAALRALHQEPPAATIIPFQQLDTQFLAHNRTRLAHDHWQRLPRYTAGGQMGRLQAEMEKKRNHLPIRQLMAQAGYAIQRIKPVFMMSPLSIATYLPPGKIQFDLVIFDEASQVRPVDAFGAIARSKQTVVVGDSRQLPPTTFFERLLGDKNEGEETWMQESILDLFCVQNAPQRMLRWHYRSRHESLIALSNQEFYDRQLVIFPSPDAAKQEVGLRYHHLPHTAYQRGKSRTNPLEAQAIATAVIQHAHSQPHLTLGVVAFSREQRQAIRQALERLRREDPSAEPFFRAHPTEPFFVKNLENVQGDERDVILISVGYGRTADGDLALNFGPLNQAGGERRLNVLITRARARCEVFANFTAADIDLRRTQAPGVVALRRFMHYAQHGEIADLPPETAAIPAPFEDVLAHALRQAGYAVAQRVGSGPARVDVAVVGEGNGRYILGIECDGDNYHLARSARDRDRIQAQTLARLGWRIHRVWSHRWWQEPEAEQARLLAAIAAPPSPTAITSYPLHERYDPHEAIAAAHPIPLYQPATLTIDLGGLTFVNYYKANKLAYHQNLLNWLAQIVQQEGPIHHTEAMRRMSYAAGYQLLTITDFLQKWLQQQGQKSKQIKRRDDFLWPAEMLRPTVRDRSQLPKLSRKFEYICPEEIAEAVLIVAHDALGIPVDDVPHRVGQLFGFRQLGGNAKTAVLATIDILIQQGWLHQQGAELFPALNPPAESPGTKPTLLQKLRVTE